MPAARDKLARLIDSRAAGLYAERIAAETAAARAEFAETAAADDVPSGQVDLEELFREEERLRLRRELEGS